MASSLTGTPSFLLPGSISLSSHGNSWMLTCQMACKDSRVGAVEEVSPQCCQKKTATSVFALLLCVTASFNEKPFGSCKNYTASLLFNAS